MRSATTEQLAARTISTALEAFQVPATGAALLEIIIENILARRTVVASAWLESCRKNRDAAHIIFSATSTSRRKNTSNRLKNNDMTATNGNPAFSGSDDKPSD